MSENSVTPFEEQKLSVLLKAPAYAKRFSDVLGDRAPQFISSLLSIGSGMPDVEPKSIIGSAMVAAALDLPIDKNLGFAWIVPYAKNVQIDGQWRKIKLASFQMGSRGFVQLAMRSSQYARMNALSINREVFKGYDVVGEPDLDFNLYDPTKPVWGYFFGFQLTNGYTKKAVWTKERVEEHAKKYSQAYRSGADIWKEHFDGMAEKTVVANTLRKWGPLSIQLQRAMQSDQAIISDIDATPEYPQLEDTVARPELEHPEKEKAKTAKEKKVEAKTEPKVEPPVEVKKPEPVVETKTAPKEDTKELAGQGLAPDPEKPTNVVQMPVQTAAPAPTVTVATTAPASAPATAPVAEPAKPAPAPEPDEPRNAEGLTEGQAALKKEIEGRGFTFDQMIAWAKVAIQMRNAPTAWNKVDTNTCKFFLKSIKGVASALEKFKKGGK